MFAQIRARCNGSASKFWNPEPGRARASSAPRWPTLACVVMGRWASGQFAIDHPGETKFRSTTFTRLPTGAAPGHGDAKYGALAWDGVGCVVCHRMQPRRNPPDPALTSKTFSRRRTRGILTREKGEIYGPFKDDEIASYAMEHATG